MEIITGLDVSMASTSVCALNANGEIVSEAKVPSDPGSLAEHLGELPGKITAVGMNAAPSCRRRRVSLVRFGLRVRSCTGIGT